VRYLPVLLPLFLATALLSGCRMFELGSPLRIEAEDWTTEGGSLGRTNATDVTLRPPLEEAWRYDADAAFGPAAAVVADGVVIVVTRQGEIRGVDLEDGRKRSVGDLHEPIEGAPVLTERVIYAPVAAGKHTIVAQDFVEGRRLWALRAGPHQAGLFLAGNTLVAAGLDGTVRALDPADGAIRWEATPDSAGGFLATPVALGPDVIAVADDRGRVTALDLATGATRWTETLEAPVYETPAARGGRLFVPTTRGRFIALSAATGAVEWVAEAGDEEVKFSPPAVAAGLVVVGASDGQLRALDAASGETVWTYRAEGNFVAAPLIAGDVVYAGALDQHLYALDRATGDELWQHAFDGRIKSVPVLHSGRLIVLAEPRHVHVFQPVSPVATTDDP
jgi:outer membrane protein assembly factor BamB